MQSLRFATSAKEGWNNYTSVSHRLRQTARRAVLHTARLTYRPEPTNFIRCLYGHAVFPEHRAKLRSFVRSLKNSGEFLTTRQLRDMIVAGDPPDGRYYHIAFDDGLANVYHVGGTIFAEENVPYTMYISTDIIGADEAKMAEYNEAKLGYRNPIRPLTWDEVRESIADGAEIGCHTQTHARLSDISNDPQALWREIAEAKAIIERETGEECFSFAWPFGKNSDIDDTSLDMIRECGFQLCFSAERGAVIPGTTDPFYVPRHQLELHWPMWELELWSSGYREERAPTAA